jgi:hypothetical protein
VTPCLKPCYCSKLRKSAFVHLVCFSFLSSRAKDRKRQCPSSLIIRQVKFTFMCVWRREVSFLSCEALI